MKWGWWFIATSFHLNVINWSRLIDRKLSNSSFNLEHWKWLMEMLTLDWISKGPNKMPTWNEIKNEILYYAVMNIGQAWKPRQQEMKKEKKKHISVTDGLLQYIVVTQANRLWWFLYYHWTLRMSAHYIIACMYGCWIIRTFQQHISSSSQ